MINTFIFAQSKTERKYFIDYYGIVSESIDSNMARMTSDLYYTQLCEIQNFTVTDKRISSTSTSLPNPDSFSEDKLSFYTEIQKNDDETWSTIIHVFNKESGSKFSKTTLYDSFYKILVESKQNLQESIRSLIVSNISTEKNISSGLALINFPDDFNDIDEPLLHSHNAGTKESLRSPDIFVSSEALSGNWIGDSYDNDYIDKIVIMKGGRGFVIFKNGASMNISVLIDESHIKIKQIGKTNASFFPELPRALALNAALDADPIEWNFKLKDSNTLIGNKRTLLPSNDSYEYGSVEVIWKRNN